ncbi:DUF4386 domain-containing protein [Nocardia sp. 2]|uniref:DUF4386 domain-containing protein n=1 Tax=Nocardia acididurans TaxID=2802282 RepID=A0ABS1M0V4_9NOCA|nr:DUF4386 domain-containing protein [Nocardia acididurans]MBL1072773.1 DUF4386 domain-containing protein [Nocardia acididurans]
MTSNPSVSGAVAPASARTARTTSTSVGATAVLLIAAVVLMNAGLSGLGSVFDYPDVLSRPAAEVLAMFRADQTGVVTWFTLLALGAALFVPIAILIGRLDNSAWMRRAVWLGVAAGLVQVVGLLRWPLLVPALADRAAREGETSSATSTFESLNRLLGTALGEMGGYLLTAAWTAIVAYCLLRRGFPRWFGALGAVSALAILTGLLTPLHVPATQQINFFGYILWSCWLLALAPLLLLRSRAIAGTPIARTKVRADALDESM